MQKLLQRLTSLLPDDDESHLPSGVRNAFLVATTFWIIGWYWVITFTVPYLIRSTAVTIDAPHFSGLLSSTSAAMVVYLFPAMAVGLLLSCRLNPSARRALIVAGLLVISAFFFHFHVSFFSLAPYIASCWAAVWILWLAISLQPPRKARPIHARRLAKSTVFFIFLGAAVGKWTGEYWTGAIIFDHWIHYYENSFIWIRWITALDQIEGIVTVLSRLTVIIETLVLFTVFLRFRYFALIFVATAFGMYVTTDHSVGAVVLPLVGICLACLCLPSASDSASKNDGSIPFRILFGTHLTLIALILAMSVTPTLQRMWMKQSHLSLENRGLWTIVHLLPKMYSFENTFPYIENPAEQTHEVDKVVENTDTELPITHCFGAPISWIGHYPSQFINTPHCYTVFRTHEEPVTVILRSRYRSTCLQSRLQVEAALKNGERILRVRQIDTTEEC